MVAQSHAAELGEARIFALGVRYFMLRGRSSFSRFGRFIVAFCHDLVLRSCCQRSSLGWLELIWWLGRTTLKSSGLETGAYFEKMTAAFSWGWTLRRTHGLRWDQFRVFLPLSTLPEESLLSIGHVIGFCRNFASGCKDSASYGLFVSGSHSADYHRECLCSKFSQSLGASLQPRYFKLCFYGIERIYPSDLTAVFDLMFWCRADL